LPGPRSRVRGLKKLPSLLRGEVVDRPAAVVAQSVMAGLSAAYVAGAILAPPR
jgi:hypothetical protein